MSSSSSHDKVGALVLKHAKLGAEWVLQTAAGKHWQPNVDIDECYQGVAPTMVWTC